MEQSHCYVKGAPTAGTDFLTYSIKKDDCKVALWILFDSRFPYLGAGSGVETLQASLKRNELHCFICIFPAAALSRLLFSKGRCPPFE